MTETTETTGLVDILVRLSHLVDHVFADVSREHRLTPQQTQLLCILNSGPVGMAELSRLLHLEKSSLSGLVDRVERRGLAVRTRDSCDRRAYHVALTSEGSQLGTKAHDGVIARLETLTEEVSPADKGVLTSALTQIIDAHGGTSIGTD